MRHDVAYLHTRLRYDPGSGKLFWREAATCSRRWNSRWAGREAGTVKDNGYVIITVDYRAYRAHHLAWAMTTGEWPVEIDHENHKRADNRWVNLRHVSRAVNRKNASLSRNSTSGVTGVNRNGSGRWRAQIMVNRKNHWLGDFDTIPEAAAARKEAEKRFNFHPNHGASHAS